MKHSRTPQSLRIPLLSLFLISSAQALIVLINYFRLQPVVPLFYSLARKDQYLVSKEWLFLFPALSLLITLTHWLILNSMKDYEPLLLKIFAWTTVGFQVILSLALVRIILIVN
jgi:hypothetical protein